MPRLVRGLWQHQNGFWYFSRMRQGVRKTVALETKLEEVAIQKALAMGDSPELALSGGLAGEIDAFIAHKLATDEYSRFSAENKKLTLKRFARWIGLETAPAKIRMEDVKRFYDDERQRIVPRTGKPPAKSTLQGYMMILRSFFTWLQKERKVTAINPVHSIKLGRWDYGSKTAYCPPEVRDAFLSHWRSIPAKVMSRQQAREMAFVAHAGFEAGLRKNEIIELRPEMFNLEARTLHIRETPTFRPKDREARSIPLTDVFIAFLRATSLTGTWCIAAEKNRGRSRYRYDFKKPFDLYIKLVGKKLSRDLAWVTPHLMRHTFGSLLAINGESLTKISEWMGDDPRITERHYLHFLEGDRAINRLHGSLPGLRPSVHQALRRKASSSRRHIRRNRKA